MSARLASALELLRRAVDDRITPGASLCVAERARGNWYTEAACVGTLAWDDPTPVSPGTVYDLASVTKPVVATGAARLADRGLLDLRAPLGALLPEARGSAVEGATLDALLSHRAGLAPWRPLYASVPQGEVGTPAGRARVLHEALREVPSPDGRAVYSDLGYILAGAAIEAATGRSLAALVRRGSVTEALRYGPVATANCAPTERCAWRGRVLRGEVHDENAFAMGGVAGHAGLFGTAEDLAGHGIAMMLALDAGVAWARAMLAPRDNGTHRLGWDTKSPQGSTAGKLMGPNTFGHLGFTGTSIWCDPDAGVIVALLTNRVHPTRANEGIRALRPAVHDAVMASLSGLR